MFAALGIHRRQLGQITNHLLSLILGSVIVAIGSNLLSSYVEKLVDLNPTTVFVIACLLIVALGLTTFVQFQFNQMLANPANPPVPQSDQYGLMLSISFLVTIIFKGCTIIETLGPWPIIGAASIPVVVGKVLIYPYLKVAHENMPPPAEPPAPVPPARDIPTDVLGREVLGVNLPAALDGRLDIEKQHVIVVIIIEAILSIKDVVNQAEIFHACRRFKQGDLSSSFIETIRLLMMRFVQARQAQYKEVEITTDDRDSWVILQKPTSRI